MGKKRKNSNMNFFNGVYQTIYHTVTSIFIALTPVWKRLFTIKTLLIFINVYLLMKVIGTSTTKEPLDPNSNDKIDINKGIQETFYNKKDRQLYLKLNHSIETLFQKFLKIRNFGKTKLEKNINHVNSTISALFDVFLQKTSKIRYLCSSWLFSGEKVFPKWHHYRIERNKPIDEIEHAKIEFEGKTKHTTFKNQETLHKLEIGQRKIMLIQLKEDLVYTWNRCWANIPGKKQISYVLSESLTLKLCKIIIQGGKTIFTVVNSSCFSYKFHGSASFFKDSLFDPLMIFRALCYFVIIGLHLFALNATGTKLLFKDLNYDKPLNKTQENYIEKLKTVYNPTNLSREEYSRQYRDSPGIDAKQEWIPFVNFVLAHVNAFVKLEEKQNTEHFIKTGLFDGHKQKNPHLINITHWYNTFQGLTSIVTLPRLSELGIYPHEEELIWMVLYWILGIENPTRRYLERKLCIPTDRSFRLSQVSNLTKEPINKKQDKEQQERQLWNQTIAVMYTFNRSYDDYYGAGSATIHCAGGDIHGLTRKFRNLIPRFKNFTSGFPHLWSNLGELKNEFLSMDPPSRIVWVHIVIHGLQHGNFLSWEKDKHRYNASTYSKEDMRLIDSLHVFNPTNPVRLMSEMDKGKKGYDSSARVITIWVGKFFTLQRAIYNRNIIRSISYLFSNFEERYNTYKVAEKRENEESATSRANWLKQIIKDNQTFLSHNKDRKMCPVYGSPGRCEEILNMIRYNILFAIIGGGSTLFAMLNWYNFKDSELRSSKIHNYEFRWALFCAAFYQLFLVNTAQSYRFEVREDRLNSFWGSLPDYVGEASIRLLLIICATICKRNFFYSILSGFMLRFAQEIYAEVWQYAVDGPEPWLLRGIWEHFIYDILLYTSFHFHSIEGRDSIAWFLTFFYFIFMKHSDCWGDILIRGIFPVIRKKLITVIKMISWDILISFSYVGLNSRWLSFAYYLNILK